MSNKKIILVTGASSGFGEELCKQLYNQDHIIYGTSEDLNSLERIKDFGINILKMDMRIKEDIDFVIEEIISKHGKIDLVYNNAGYGEFGYVEIVDLEKHREQFEVNFFGPIYLTQKVLPYMKTRNEGRIIFTGSIASHISFMSMGIYSASKHALYAIATALRQELIQTNIKIVFIEPDASFTGFCDFAINRYDENLRLANSNQLLGYDSKIINEKVRKYYLSMFDIKNATGKEKTVKTMIYAGLKNNPKNIYRPTFKAKLYVEFFKLLPVKITDKFFTSSLKGK